MTRKPFKKIFENKELLERMLQMRRVGWGYNSLALVFGVDYSSIYHECKKFKVSKSGNVSLGIKPLLEQLDIKVPKNKSYADYLKDAGYKSQSYYLNISI